jgi:hypothetical protein
VLERVNAKPGWEERTCHEVAAWIQRHFRLLIFHDLELWANNTSLVARVPATAEEELRYRRENLYGNTGPLDLGTSMPPSPTIEVAGVRFGTDKLTHFFSEGWIAYQWYRDAIDLGKTRDEAEREATLRGIKLENSFLGTRVSGVFSVADLEANHAGMLWYIGLCNGDSPGLTLEEHGWELAERFDFREHVTPAWDESYQPSVFTEGRWSKVRPVMLQYCPMLHSPQVVRQRKRYAEREGESVTLRRVVEMVEQGKLADPATFGIEQLCSDAADEAGFAQASGRSASAPDGSD